MTYEYLIKLEVPRELTELEEEQCYRDLFHRLAGCAPSPPPDLNAEIVFSRHRDTTLIRELS